MRKLSVLFSFFLILFFFSCSNNNQDAITDQNTIDQNTNERELQALTLKEILSAKNEDTIWTKELEPDILSYSLRDEDFLIGSNIELSSEVLSLFSNKKVPLYPDLDTFGSLNISKLNDAVISKIESFLKSVSENPYGEQTEYFDSKYIFNYVFFLNDIKNSWRTNTGKEFPVKEDFIITSNDSSNDLNNSKKTKLFSKWLYGEPFISDAVIQLPVRLYLMDSTNSNNSYININLFLKNNESLNIYNLSIKSWGGK